MKTTYAIKLGIKCPTCTNLIEGEIRGIDRSGDTVLISVHVPPVVASLHEGCDRESILQSLYDCAIETLTAIGEEV